MERINESRIRVVCARCIVIISYFAELQTNFYSLCSIIKMPKVKANKVARSPSSMPYETREATKVVLTETVRSMRKNGPVDVHFLQRRDADECRPLVEGGVGYEKTPTTFLFCCATVVSQFTFQKWLFGKAKGKSPNEGFTLQIRNAASKLAEGVKRNQM